jgi:membrane AbrB-like protein
MSDDKSRPEDRPDRPGKGIHPILAVIGGIALAMAGAMLWRLLKLPLPWLVGALYGVGLARIIGLPLRPLPGGRQFGQWVIGANIGLYFTAAVVVQLLSHAALIAGMALVSMALGILGAAAIVRLGLADPPTAFLSSLPGGASEMANLSHIWNAAVDQVAAAHTTRVMLVVLIVPLLLSAGVDAGAGYVSAPGREASLTGVVAMVAASAAGVGAFLFLRFPNAWVLGTLLPIAVLGALDVALPALPGWMTAGGQLLIGLALGSRFAPGFLRKAPQFLAAIALLSLVFLAAVGLMAFLLAPPAGLTVPNLFLSFVPGGIAEMSITATHLNLAVPLVVASHVVRLVLLMVLAPFSYRLFLLFIR